jgi:hypothetical protein
MSRLTVSSGEIFLIAAFTVFGIGLGMVDGQISHAAVSAMPPSQAGLASGIASASRQVGQALGVAVTGALVNASLHGGTVRTDFVAASRPAWLVLAGCGCLVFLLGLTITRGRSQRAAAPAAAAPPAGAPSAASTVRPRYSMRPQARLDPAARFGPDRAPRLPVRQLPPAAEPAFGSPTNLTRRDQVYYRRQWRAGTGPGQSLPVHPPSGPLPGVTGVPRDAPVTRVS